MQTNDNYYKPPNRKGLEAQIKGMKPDYKLSRYTLNQLWHIRAVLLRQREARDKAEYLNR